MPKSGRPLTVTFLEVEVKLTL